MTFKNLASCFKDYNLDSIHLKSNPSGFGLSWFPITCEGDLTDEAMEDINEAILTLLENEVFTDGEYDFMVGVFTYDGARVILEGSQTRDIYFTDIQS